MFIVVALAGALIWLSIVLVVVGACRSASQGDRAMVRQPAPQATATLAGLPEAGAGQRSLEHA